MGGHSTIPITCTLGQTPWVTGCVCQTTSTMTASIDSSCCWKLDWCEGLHSKLHTVVSHLSTQLEPARFVRTLDSWHVQLQ